MTLARRWGGAQPYAVRCLAAAVLGSRPAGARLKRPRLYKRHHRARFLRADPRVPREGLGALYDACENRAEI